LTLDQLEKWRQKIEKFLADPNQKVFVSYPFLVDMNKELVSPKGISGAERKAIHSVAEEKGICTTTILSP
jgi:hypothetical protein